MKHELTPDEAVVGLLGQLAEAVAEAIAADRLEEADRWAELAFRLRGTDSYDSRRTP